MFVHAHPDLHAHLCMCAASAACKYAWRVKSFKALHKIANQNCNVSAQVEVQEAYGKQPPQRYPLDPPDAKAVTGADSSTHNRGLGGPLPHLPLSVQPGECLVQVRLPQSSCQPHICIASVGRQD